jgi:hypothetical protein
VLLIVSTPDLAKFGSDFFADASPCSTSFSGGDPLPPLEALGHYHLSEASLNNLAVASFIDGYRWLVATHTYMRWSGGHELVESTWTTLSTTVQERKGRELWGCVYKYMPLNELDWPQLDAAPLTIYRQVALFERYVACARKKREEKNLFGLIVCLCTF